MLEVARHPSPPGNRRPTMTEAYDGRQVVGIDLHRRRSVLVRMTEDGRKLETVRIENSPQAVLAKLGVPVTHSDIFGVHGQAWLDGLRLLQPYAGKCSGCPAQLRWARVAGFLWRPQGADGCRRCRHGCCQRYCSNLRCRRSP